MEMKKKQNQNSIALLQNSDALPQGIQKCLVEKNGHPTVNNTSQGTDILCLPCFFTSLSK